MSEQRVYSGLERLLGMWPFPLAGLRVGLLAHPASVDRALRHAIDLLLDRKEMRLASLFGPEHGIHAAWQYLEGVASAVDPRTQLPVHSLYGTNNESLRPTPQMLEGLDVLVVDLQDVGARYYTYVHTLAYCLEAAAQAGLRVMVLDRPNPISGTAIEGNLVQQEFRSFVGYIPLAVRHGMTVGEVARYANTELQIGCTLEVIQLAGWERRMHFQDTGLPWVPPSPNMPTPDTALVYPGMCLLEGTNLSEGRGTTRPFEIFGAPFIDPHALKERLDEMELPGIIFRALRFRPLWDKWCGEVCGGLQLHVTERDRFKPFLTGVAILSAVSRLYPAELKWREEPYEFVSDRPAIDLLFGNGFLRPSIEEGLPPARIEAGWEDELLTFARSRERYLLY